MDPSRGPTGAEERLRKLEGLRLERPEDETRTRPISVWWTGMAVPALVLGLAFAWGRLADPISEVKVAEVSTQRGTPGIQRTSALEGTGYVVARRRATVASEVTGRIAALLVEEGTWVEQGQVLARLDAELHKRRLELAEAELAEARSAALEAEARLDKARGDWHRARELAAANIASQAALDAAVAEFEALRARLAAAREAIAVARSRVRLRKQELDDTVVRAPYAGIVISREAQPGEVVSPLSIGGRTSAGICTIIDPDSLEVEVEVNEIYVSRVRPDQPARVVLDAYPGWEIPASVITTIPAADRQKATVRIRVRFEADSDPRILPDMGTKVFFATEERAEGDDAVAHVLVPRAALRHDESGITLAFALAGDRVERRVVRVEDPDSASELALILDGLTPGERVVVEGPESLDDGDRVLVVPSEPAG